MLEYYRVFTKQIKPLQSVSQLLDLYHPSVAQKNGELFVKIGTGLAAYALYKYLKYMTDEEKLYGTYYQLDHLWTGGKVIKELHKITSIPRKYIRSSLAKQALWQVHIPPPKEINHPHYDVTKPNEPHQFVLLYMSLNVFEGNTYKYILTDVDVASRYKVARTLRTKKSSQVAFLLEAI